MSFNDRQEIARKYLKPLVVLAVLALVIVIGLTVFRKGPSTNVFNSQSSSDNRVTKQTITLNQTFNIPIDASSPQDKPILVTFSNAELTNQILVNGQRTMARSGTKFLMLNVLIENDTSNRLNFRTRDVIRLIDQNNKPFAPSYFNASNTTLEPDSVKKDVAGFLVPDSIKTFKIQYGSLTGDKQFLELKFK